MPSSWWHFDGRRVAPMAQRAALKVRAAPGPTCEEEQMVVRASDDGCEKGKTGEVSGGSPLMKTWPIEGGRTRGKVLFKACRKGGQEGAGQEIGAWSDVAPPRQPMDV
jgi:hypothetical protein